MRLRSHRTQSSRAGLSLVEMAIAVSLVVLLMASAILAAKGGQGAFRATQTATDVETRVRRTLDRVATELLCAGNMLPDPIPAQFGTSFLDYCQVRPWDWDNSGAGAGDGVNGVNVLWANPSRITFELEPGETDDGTDEDGDGLVDEGRVVLVRDVGGANEHRVVLCSGVRELLEGEEANGLDDNGNGVVDEEGFNIHQIGNVLYVRLSVEVPGENGSIVRTLETSVRLRN